ncbi:MAG: hypothetical protein ABH848_02995 [Candidatus Omnitrophota bacterium]
MNLGEKLCKKAIKYMCILALIIFGLVSIIATGSGDSTPTAASAGGSGK